MENKVSIKEIGMIVGKCYDDFQDVWTGYNPDLDKIDVICASEHHLDESAINNRMSKIKVHLSKRYGTQFVEHFFNIFIIIYL